MTYFKTYDRFMIWGNIAKICMDEYPGLILVDTEYSKIDRAEIPNGVYSVVTQFPVQVATNLQTQEIFYLAPRGINRRRTLPFDKIVDGYATKNVETRRHRGFMTYVINGREFMVIDGVLKDASDAVRNEEENMLREWQQKRTDKLNAAFSNFAFIDTSDADVRTIIIYNLPGGAWFDEYVKVTFDENATLDIPQYEDPIDVLCDDSEEDKTICEAIEDKIGVYFECSDDHKKLYDGCFVSLNGEVFKVHLIEVCR